MNKGRFGQPCADGAVFSFVVDHKLQLLGLLGRSNTHTSCLTAAEACMCAEIIIYPSHKFNANVD
jgi:hypothetical protein